MLNPEKLERTAAIICLDFDDPMEIMNNLRKWLTTLQKSLFKLFEGMETGAFDKMKNKI